MRFYRERSDFLRKYLLAAKKELILQILFYGLYTVPIAAIPYITKLLFDKAHTQSIYGVLFLVFLYILAVALGMILQYLCQTNAWKTDSKFCKKIKQDFFDATLKYDYVRFSKKEIGEYISVLNNDIPVLMDQYITAIICIIEACIEIIIYGTFLVLSAGNIITFTILFFSLFSLILPKFTGKILSERTKQHLDAAAMYIVKVNDLWSGFKLVSPDTSTNISNEEKKYLYETENKKLHYGKYRALTIVLNGSFMYALNIVAFAIMGILLYLRKITIGSGVATLGYISSFVYPIRSIMDNINNLKGAESTVKKTISLLSTMEESAVNTTDITEFHSSIIFSDVSLSYKQFTLRNFSYKFQKGKKYAIIGGNGAGKSTIFNLLMNYAKADSGNIFIDNSELSSYSTKQIVYCISQSDHIFADTFENNVTIFNSFSSDSFEYFVNYFSCPKIKQLCNITDCSRLSGGEKQLISLIRAVVSNRPVLLLDESFSALDFQTTILMQEKLYHMESKTIITITHDLSKRNLEQFDEVLLLQNGELIAHGSPDEIFRKDSFISFLKAVNNVL